MGAKGRMSMADLPFLSKLKVMKSIESTGRFDRKTDSVIVPTALWMYFSELQVTLRMFIKAASDLKLYTKTYRKESKWKIQVIKLTWLLFLPLTFHAL